MMNDIEQRYEDASDLLDSLTSLVCDFRANIDFDCLAVELQDTLDNALKIMEELAEEHREYQRHQEILDNIEYRNMVL